MATNKIPMLYTVEQNNNRMSKAYGKFYAQPVVNTTLNLKGFARHIADHNGTFKASVIKGVMEEMVECLTEMVAQGIGVKLDGLGTFYPTFECKGALTAETFNIAEQLQGIHIRFLPEGTKDEELTSRKFLEKCVLKRIGDNDSGSDDPDGGQG